MTFTYITLAYLLLYLIRQSLELALEFINARYMKKRINTIPDHLSDMTDPDTYRKAIHYNLAAVRFHIPYRLTRIACHWAFLIAGFQTLDSWLRHFEFDQILTGLLFFALYTLIISIIDLPFSIYHDFVLEEQFGFNRKTWRVFLTDLFKNTLVGLLLGGPLLLSMLWLMETAGSYWWLFGIGIVIAFQILILWLAPSMILPLFNKMTPLEGDIRKQIENLARKAAFPARDILTMDGSRRSGHANAFFTGIGRLKKIVFYDTLLQKINPTQILAVLAHEMAHYILGHIRKKIWLMMAGIILFFALLALLRQHSLFYVSLGFQTPSTYAAIVIFSTLFTELVFPFQLLLTRLSRKYEYQSDAFAVSLTRDPDSLIEALHILHTTNLSAPVTHPAYAAYHYSHPDLPERIQAIRRIPIPAHPID
ncbi:M48 family metallopeptidase [bacterium]|nr:M48 family metallopeptidase [candidate division CSSED10-310 bacterium]